MHGDHERSQRCAIRAAAACQLWERGFNLRTDIWCYHLQAVKAETGKRKLLTLRGVEPHKRVAGESGDC